MMRESIIVNTPPSPIMISSEVPKYSFYLKDDLSAPFKKIIGKNSTLLEQLLIADRAAATSCRVLINGSSGVGKELVARAIQKRKQQSCRTVYHSELCRSAGQPAGKRTFRL